jgi:hypothetical protein
LSSKNIGEGERAEGAWGGMYQGLSGGTCLLAHAECLHPSGNPAKPWDYMAGGDSRNPTRDFIATRVVGTAPCPVVMDETPYQEYYMLFEVLTVLFRIPQGSNDLKKTAEQRNFKRGSCVKADLLAA